MEPGSLLADLALDYFALCRTAGLPQLRFSMGGDDPGGTWHQELKARVAALLLASGSGGPAQAFHEMGEFYFLAQLLLEHFLERQGEPGEGGRSGQLLALLRSSESAATLQELAAQLHLSPSAASRMFREATGENFSDYKRRTRLERVKWELARSDLPVTTIAIEAGFTSFSVFNRAFKDAFGVTPSQYRREQAVQGREEGSGAAMDRVFRILQREKQAQDSRNDHVYRVEGDITRGTPRKRRQNQLLNVGPAHLLQGAAMQNQVAFLAERLGVEYIRIWSLFSPEMMLQDGTGRPFNFSFLDTVLDFCVDRKLKLFLDLAQRRDFSLASERSTIFSRETPQPLDWFQVLEEFLVHIRRRYTEEVVSQWVFEMTFFLNDKPYFSGGSLSNLEVWKRGWGIIKAALPRARVAGPGLVCGNPEESERIVRNVLGSGSPPDIFTSTHYPYAYEGSLREETIFQKRLIKMDDPYFLVGQLKFLRGLLDRLEFSGEFWVTEWGCSLANRNFVQDSCYRGAFTLEQHLDAVPYADSLGIFVASDILSAYGDSGTLSGSAGLLSQTGIHKPAYYAYRFLETLGRWEVCRGPHCVVTREEEGDVRIVCFNGKALGPRYYLAEESSHTPQEVDGLFTDLEPLEVELVLHGFREDHGKYYVRQRILNEKRGGALGKWRSLGCVAHPSRDDLEFLERTSVPDVELAVEAPAEGTLRLRFTMEPNELRSIVIL